jgi:hypothetical protein
MARFAIRLLSATEVAAMFAFTAALVHGQEGNRNQPTVKIESTRASGSVKTADGPKFTEYRGVRIGMSVDDTRQKLGNPREKDKTQDLFVFSSRETAQVFYDKQQKVYAISIDYAGKDRAAPTPADVLGKDITAKTDGSMYQMQEYPEAGYWVSYNRTAGDTPLVTVTMQKIPGSKQ